MALLTTLALMIGLLAGCGSSGGNETQNPGGGNEEIDLVCTGLLTSPAQLVPQGLLQPMTERINNSEILKPKPATC